MNAEISMKNVTLPVFSLQLSATILKMRVLFAMVSELQDVLTNSEARLGAILLLVTFVNFYAGSRIDDRSFCHLLPYYFI